MLKTRKIKKIIITVFLIYLVASFAINAANIYRETGIQKAYNYSIEELRVQYENEYNSMTEKQRQEEGMESIENLTDEEFKNMIEDGKKTVFIISIFFGLFVTFIKNFMLIIIFIVILVVNRRSRRDKLNKDDFFKSEQYYRDILEQKGICEISYIDDFKIEEKDIIAEILQLENKKVISVSKDKIIINEDYDKTKLKKSQQYILDNIQNGKLKKIDEFILKAKIKQDALEDELIEEKKNLIKRCIKKIIMSVIIIIFANIIDYLIFINLSGNIIWFFIAAAFSIIFLFIHPIISIFSFMITIIKHNMDPYFRTEKGKDLNRQIEGLKRFLKDYTSLDERNKEAVVIWEEYLVYSVLFNQNKKIVNQYKNYIE